MDAVTVTVRSQPDQVGCPVVTWHRSHGTGPLPGLSPYASRAPSPGLDTAASDPEWPARCRSLLLCSSGTRERGELHLLPSTRSLPGWGERICLSECSSGRRRLTGWPCLAGGMELWPLTADLVCWRWSVRGRLRSSAISCEGRYASLVFSRHLPVGWRRQ